MIIFLGIASVLWLTVGVFIVATAPSAIQEIAGILLLSFGVLFLGVGEIILTLRKGGGYSSGPRP
jgi:hypothetical protein